MALSNDFLKMVGMSQTVFVVMIVSGVMLLVTAAVGVTASYTKNQCLAFMVNMLSGSYKCYSMDTSVYVSC
jgi:hypothetical protein